MNEKFRGPRRARVGAAVLTCATVAACGGSGPTSPPPTLMPPPVVTVLLEGSQSGLQPLFLYSVGTFTTTVTGRLDVTVDWTFAANNIDVYVTRGTCTIEQFRQQTCPIVRFSESTLKPEGLAMNGLPPETYELLIGNRGPGAESVSFRAVLTH